MESHRARWSRLAIASCGCVLVALLIPAISDVIDGWLAVMFDGLVLSSILLGHTAFSHIRRSNGELRGRYVAIAGTCCGYLFVLFILYMLLTADRHGYMRNEAVAVQTVKQINLSEQSFAQKNGGSAYACSLKELEADLKNAMGPSSDELVARFVETGARFGYVFQVHCGDMGTSEYFVTAVPQRFGRSGIRSFCADHTGVIRYIDGADVESCFKRGQSVYE